ncbi:MAG: vitamin K epoxide reductase family protein [Patulibacter sp.]|nr:vitamin K epoxide reductase family protein [Patulibacter sp.]
MTDRRTGGLPTGERWLGVLLLVAGIVGLVAAFALAIEKQRLLENPFYVPACSLGEAVDCGAVMRSAQATTFGVSNAFIGLAGFGGLLATGLLVATGARLTTAYRVLLQIGLTFAVVLVHWLIFHALYRIGALCPFCMAVWAATIPSFWYVTLDNTRALARRDSPVGRLVAALHRNHGVVITTWLLLIALLVVERFYAPWESIFA